MQEGNVVNTMEGCSLGKSEIDLLSEWAKAVLILTKTPILFKKEISLYETMCIVTPNLKMVLDEWTNINAETKAIFAAKHRSRLSKRATNVLCV